MQAEVVDAGSAPRELSIGSAPARACDRPPCPAMRAARAPALDRRLTSTARCPGHLPPVQQELDLVGAARGHRRVRRRRRRPDRRPVGPRGLRLPELLGRAELHPRRHLRRRHPRPRRPEEVDFIPPQPGYYHGEGAHVVSIDTPQFTGDLLAVNDEACSNDDDAPADVPITAGGFDLYDVTDPEQPGDAGPERRRHVAATARSTGTRTRAAAELLPQRLRLAGRPAGLPGRRRQHRVRTTSTSSTSPTRRNPEFIADLDLVDAVPGDRPDRRRGATATRSSTTTWSSSGSAARCGCSSPTGTPATCSSTSTNPATPTYITDTNFDEPDPLTGFDPPRATPTRPSTRTTTSSSSPADEDFAPFRLGERRDHGAARRRRVRAGAVGDAEPIASLARRHAQRPDRLRRLRLRPASAPIPPRDIGGCRRSSPARRRSSSPARPGRTTAADDPDGRRASGEKVGERRSTPAADAVLLGRPPPRRCADDGVVCGSRRVHDRRRS